MINCKRCGATFEPEFIKSLKKFHSFCPTCRTRNLFDGLGLPTPPILLDRHTKRPTLTKAEFSKEIAKPIPEEIKFKHRYYKLAGDQFTTIRGKAQFKKLKVNQVVEVIQPGETFMATIVALELKKVSAMSVEFLKADAEYPGFVINTVSDFVDLLNSFRAPAWTQVTEESELTVITLQR